VATYVALTHTRVNIPDAYAPKGVSFSGPKAFDAQTGYHSMSLLTIPLEDENNEVIGVLQLINAKDHQTGAPIPFTPDDVVETLVLLASAALSSYRREEKLHREIEQLRIQIDKERRDKHVSEIIETDYFQHLQSRAKELRKRK
jgi:GAF domain-containing protein